MKDIKFRAWDRANKKMLYDDPHSSIHRMMTWSGIVYSNGVQQEYEMMQYIGKDIEDREIYEGDLVKCFPSGLIGQVVWDDQSSGFVVLIGRDIVTIYPSFRRQVIGNIYENPELL